MEIKNYQIKTAKLKKTERPLRLVLLSDLHDRLWGEGQETLLSAIDALKGDLVLCAGDMLLSGKKVRYGHTRTLFEGLARRGLTVIAANGNHESRIRQRAARCGQQYREYAAQLRGLGVRLLEDEACSVPFGSREAFVHGYELPLGYYRRFRSLPYDTADLTRKFGKLADGAFHILLAHNPVYFETYAKWGADLTLSGHLHGGIIRLPGIGGLISPQAKLFPRYDRGLFEKQGKYMVVSAGLGEHTIPIRICNPPQLVGITIRGTG